MAALFSIDSFAGGLVVNALLSLWLLQRFRLDLAQTGRFFFWSGLLGAARNCWHRSWPAGSGS